MERLTHRYTDGEAWASIYKIYACGEYECRGPIIDRLAAYEDIGLTPEEIMILCSMDCRAKMAELLRMEENKPLALEQLMEMDGEPVFLTPIQSACTNDKQGAWALVDLNQRMCRVSGGGLAVFENCGKTWMAYRYKPENGGRE